MTETTISRLASMVAPRITARCTEHDTAKHNTPRREKRRNIDKHQFAKRRPVPFGHTFLGECPKV